MDESWERAIAAAAGGQADPRALTLDGAVKCLNGRLPSRALLERFQNLEHLSIANVRLASLEGFPHLPSLRRLILSDNRIAGGLDSLVAAGLGALRDLDLSNNRIQSVEDLAPLAELRLVSLDLYECPVTRTKDYRSRVFGMIGSLKYLDKMDADGNERPETDDDEDDDEDEEDEEEEEDLGNGEVDGDDRSRNTANGVAANGSGLHRVNGSREGEDGEEEEEDDEDDNEDLGEEIDEEEENEGDEEVEEEGAEEPGSRGRMMRTEGEIDGHEQGEDDEDDGEGEQEEEDVGAEYIIQPVAQVMDEAGASAIDACNEGDGSEDVEDGEDDRSNISHLHPSSSSQANKRKKDGGDNFNDDSIEDSRPPKHH